MSKHAELAKAPITTTTAANPFWLEQYVTTLSPSGDIVVDLKHAIDLAAQLDGGARLPDAALTLVLYAKAQIEFLNQFSRFGGNEGRALLHRRIRLLIVMSMTEYAIFCANGLKRQVAARNSSLASMCICKTCLAQWTGVLVYAILASAAVYTYIYTPELDHRRAVRECQVIVGCDDGDESFGACINRE